MSLIRDQVSYLHGQRFLTIATSNVLVSFIAGQKCVASGTRWSYYAKILLGLRCHFELFGHCPLMFDFKEHQICTTLEVCLIWFKFYCYQIHSFITVGSLKPRRHR